MKEQDIVDRIVDIAVESAFDGLNRDFAEREAEKIAKEIMKFQYEKQKCMSCECDVEKTEAIVQCAECACVPVDGK